MKTNSLDRTVKPEEVPAEIMLRLNHYAKASRECISEGVLIATVAIIYLLSGHASFVLLEFHDDDEKRRIKKKLRRLITKKHARACLIIADAEARCIQHGAKMPTFLPPGSIEALLLEYRGADHHYTVVQQYTRSTDGSITFDDMVITETNTELPDGWFAGCTFKAA